MKKILAFFFLVQVAFAQSSSITVDADKQLNTDFSKYKTFAWASQVDSKLAPGVYFLGDLALKERIRNAVGYEMEARGYQKIRQTPDLLVNFRVFDQAATIKGYSGYGTTYWGNQEVRQAEDTTSFQVQPGTLIVNVVDTKTGAIVWRGFASGLIDNSVFEKREDKIKEAVHLIYNQYPTEVPSVGNKK